nr:MAG TPA: hypothetical protein [Caudoviricetes sp.]
MHDARAYEAGTPSPPSPQTPLSTLTPESLSLAFTPERETLRGS